MGQIYFGVIEPGWVKIQSALTLERSHQGYRLKGRTPVQALMDALAITEIPDIIPAEEINEPLPTAA